MNEHKKRSRDADPHHDKDDDVLVCDICSAEFDSNWSFTRHMRVHNNVLPFECSFCDKRFVQKCSKDRHEASHSQQRPWNCVFCNKNFKLKEYLTHHKIKQHQDILKDVLHFQQLKPDLNNGDQTNLVQSKITELQNKLDIANNMATSFARRLLDFHISLTTPELLFLNQL